MIALIRKVITAVFIVFIFAMLTVYLIAANSPYKFAPDGFCMCMMRNDDLVMCIDKWNKAGTADEDGIPAKYKNARKRGHRLADVGKGLRSQFLLIT